MKYVDGFLLPVEKKKLSAYRKMAEMGSKMWKRHGALEYFECVGDDLYPKSMGMEIARFPKVMKLKKGEVPVFSFIIYKSRAHRDAVTEKVYLEMSELMKDPKHKDMVMPFEVKRMAYGGFKAIVEG